MRERLYDLGLSKSFLFRIQKEEIKKLDFINVKNFYFSTKKTEKQAKTGIKYLQQKKIRDRIHIQDIQNTPKTHQDKQSNG